MKVAVLLFIVLFITQLNSQEAVARNVPTEGLVAYYPFSGDANDASGNGNNGAVSGATLSTDRFGNPQGAYSFVAANHDYIRVPNQPQLQITNNLTISVWMKHTAWAAFYEDIVMKGNETYGFQFNSTTDAVLFHLKQANGSWRNLNSNYVPVTDQWFNVVGTFDGSTQRVYVNGTQTNFALWTGMINSDTSTLDFAAQVAGDNAWYNGELDDLRIYNRALSADEVLQLYAETSSYIGTPLDVAIIHSNGQVTVSWQAVPGATSYVVQSSSTPEGIYTADHSGSYNGTSWIASSTDAKRFYHVVAVME